MMENFEQENWQPKNPEAADEWVEQEAGIETEDQLTELAGEIRTDIDRTSQESVTDATDSVAAALAEYGGDSAEGDSVHKELDDVNEKITSLAKESSEAIEEIISGEGETTEPTDTREKEIRDREERLAVLEAIRQEIEEDLPEEEKGNKGLAPTDIELSFMDQEEKEKRREMILGRYREVLEKIKPVGKKLETDLADLTETELGEPGTEEFSYDQLVFVRADSFPPHIAEDGSVQIQNALEGSGGESDRTTNHYALNHRVHENDGGNWENSEYQFIIPGTAMVEANGEPENLYPVDTFYECSNVIPEGSIIIYEKGKKPELPPDFEGKVLLIERDEDINDDELVDVVIERMGYTPVIGDGAHAEGAFDEAVGSLAEKNGLDSGLHTGNWTTYMEYAKSSATNGDFSSAILQLEQLGSDEKYDRMPEEKRIEAWKEYLEGALHAKPEDITLDIQQELLVEKSIEKDSLSQEDAEEQRKQQIAEDNLNKGIDIIQGLLEGSRAIDKAIHEDAAKIFDNMPDGYWQHLADRLKSQVGVGIESFSDIGEAKDFFDRQYRGKYQRITGKELSISVNF